MDLIKELENLSERAGELYVNSVDDVWALDITDNIVYYIEKQQKYYEKKRDKKHTIIDTILHFFYIR